MTRKGISQFPARIFAPVWTLTDVSRWTNFAASSTKAPPHNEHEPVEKVGATVRAGSGGLLGTMLQSVLRWRMSRAVAWGLTGLAIASMTGIAPAIQPASAQSAPRDTRSAAEIGAPHKDRVTEAAHALTGAAANPECIWLGQNAVNRIWNSDLDTAFRHLDLYDRFGCPGTHIQTTFRCVVKLYEADPKPDPNKADPSKADQNKTETSKADKLNDRIQACWINAENPVAPAASGQTEQAPAQPR
jgi:hypothetical protein